LDKLTYYLTRQVPLYRPLLRYMLHGVRVDVAAAEAKTEEFKDRCEVLKHEIAVLAGRPLHSWKQGATWYVCEVHPGRRYKCAGHCKAEVGRDGKRVVRCGAGLVVVPGPITEGVSISNAKLGEYLYGSKSEGGCGLPVRRKKKRVTVQESALRDLRLKHAEQCGDILDKILDFRRVEKLGSFFSGNTIDHDGRVRCHYKNLVQTGRLSSRGNPRGTGLNLQNVDRELRYLVKSDRGRLFLSMDQSQAEDRVVKVLSGVPAAITKARLRPNEFDTHTDLAMRIMSRLHNREVSFGEVTKELRYMFKRARHGKNYGLSGVKLAEVFINEGYSATIEWCQNALNLVEQVDPYAGEYHRRIIREINRNHKLTNSWGWTIDFAFERISDELYRRGFAFIPQGDVGILTNELVIQLDAWMTKTGKTTPTVCGMLRTEEEYDYPNLQVHDEVMWSVLWEDIWDVARFMRDVQEQPRLYSINPNEYEPVELVIPAEFTVKRDWAGAGGKVEFKSLPETKEEFYEKLSSFATSD